jgi:hypothetical protein
MPDLNHRRRTVVALVLWAVAVGLALFAVNQRPAAGAAAALVWLVGSGLWFVRYYKDPDAVSRRLHWQLGALIAHGERLTWWLDKAIQTQQHQRLYFGPAWGEPPVDVEAELRAWRGEVWEFLHEHTSEADAHAVLNPRPIPAIQLPSYMRDAGSHVDLWRETHQQIERLRQVQARYASSVARATERTRD